MDASLMEQFCERLERLAADPLVRGRELFAMPATQMVRVAGSCTKLSNTLAGHDPFMRGDVRCAYSVAVGMTTGVSVLCTLLDELATGPCSCGAPDPCVAPQFGGQHVPRSVWENKPGEIDTQ